MNNKLRLVVLGAGYAGMTLVRILFYGMCSGFTKVPIHHNVNSKVSGAGKSYLLILVGGYLPDKYVISLAGMSNKALLHGQGIQVFEDESTGEVHPVRPYIREIQGLIPWETIADGSLMHGKTQRVGSMVI